MYNISCYNCTNKLNGACVCTLVSDENEETCKYYKEFQKMKDSILNQTPEQVIKEMIKKYGKDSQIDVCIEEMSELTKALVKERRTRLYNCENAFSEASKDDIKEELADVLFMCQYLCQIFNFKTEEISDIINKKALRTQQRYLGGDK